MSFYQGLQAETVPFRGHNGDQGEAYYARPARAGKFPGVVVIHHIPGWCEWTTEVVRKFAHHGYAAISPHLYFREGNPGEAPDDLGARIRAAGGVADAQVMGDVAAAMAYLRAQPNATGKLHTNLSSFVPGTGWTFYGAQALGSTFSDPGLDNIGNVRRNSYFGPTFFNTDMSVQKSFDVWENFSMKFRFDAINAVNHINPGNPGGYILSAGTITGEAPGPGPRQLTFGLSLKF